VATSDGEIERRGLEQLLWTYLESGVGAGQRQPRPIHQQAAFNVLHRHRWRSACFSAVPEIWSRSFPSVIFWSLFWLIGLRSARLDLPVDFWRRRNRNKIKNSCYCRINFAVSSRAAYVASKVESTCLMTTTKVTPNDKTQKAIVTIVKLTVGGAAGVTCCGRGVVGGVQTGARWAIAYWRVWSTSREAIIMRKCIGCATLGFSFDNRNVTHGNNLQYCLCKQV